LSVHPYALQLAEAGFPVFPCGPDKKPWCKHGFYAASTNPEALDVLWRGKENAYVGMPCGAVSGIDILDIDPKHGGMAWWNAHRSSIPETRIHSTRSGGLHVLFRAYPAMRNSQSIIAPGIDTRGVGGYLIYWPAHGCEVMSSAPIVPWPAWLLQHYLKKAAPPPAAKRTIRPRSASSSISVQAARDMVDRSITRVKHASAGQRHFRLRAASCTVGGLLDLAQLGENEVLSQLVNAVIDAGAEDHKNAEKTALWGLKKGSLSPIEPKERRR
jgi:Bifunctional DNA primase/polymerase, N-terminal